MENFDPAEVRAVLLSRGIALNPPISDTALGKLTLWAGGSIHRDVELLLRQFDGFASGNFDAESFVSVWPIAQAMSDDWSNHPTLAFSDWSLNAIIFGFNPTESGPIISIEDGRIIAPSYADFWSFLLADRLL